MAEGDIKRPTDLMDRHLQSSEGKLRQEPEREVDLLQLFKPATRQTASRGR
jgi:hypothetical protein